MHDVNQLSDLLINLMRFSCKYFLEEIICCIVNFLRCVGWGDLAREEFSKLIDYFSDICECLRLNLGIVLIPQITDVFEGDTKFLLAQVRPLKDLLFEGLKLVGTAIRAALLVLDYRRNNMLLDIFQKSFDEGSAYFGDATA